MIRQFHQSQLNFSQLTQLFKEEFFIPLTYSSLSPDILLHILNDITVNKRCNIIEFGSGASTIYIAKLLKTLNLDNVNFFTVESNKTWIDELNKHLKKYEINDVVKVIFAPIVEVPTELSYLNQKTWFDDDVLINSFEESIEFDLIIVDGPIGACSPFARYSAIPFLKKNLAKEFSIFLDDTRRPEEEEIAEQWKKLLNCKIEKFKRYSVLSSSNNFVSLPFQLEL